MKRLFLSLFIISTVVIVYFYLHSTPKPKHSKHVKEIVYWQFWTGFEEEAIEKVVEKFNKEHKNIKVKMLTISEPWKKTLLSIIGGTPPDVLNTTSEWLPELAQRGALIPLEKYCKKHKIKKEMFIPVYFEMLEFNVFGIKTYLKKQGLILKSLLKKLVKY
ncbi:MAG: extracellular solute-binding protein [Candidatus Melainabacteria bacterium]|nr:extracellular solute-binding protein [Candidatus Melainabacteria bacterium]